jgi:hypothetical protein
MKTSNFVHAIIHKDNVMTEILLPVPETESVKFFIYMRVYPKVFGLAAWSENYKWYSFLPLGAAVSLFYESV